MAWRDALIGVPWDTVFRRAGIVFAAAQLINAVRGVGITRALRCKLRRARRDAAKRKRAAMARKAQAKVAKQIEARQRRADAKATKQTTKDKNNDDGNSQKKSKPIVKQPSSSNPAIFNSDLPTDNTWLSGRYSETIPIELEKEIAAAALDEVAMALAAEGDAAASFAVSQMAMRVAKSESPKKIRLEALSNLKGLTSSNFGSNELLGSAAGVSSHALVGEVSGGNNSRNDRQNNSHASRNDDGQNHTSRHEDGGSFSVAGSRDTFSFHSPTTSHQTSGSVGAAQTSSTQREYESRSQPYKSLSQPSPSPTIGSLTPSPESYSNDAFEIAKAALAMGDETSDGGLTDDDEAAAAAEAESRRRRSDAARGFRDAEATRVRRKNEADIEMAAAAGASAAAICSFGAPGRRASFEEWATAGGVRARSSTRSSSKDKLTTNDDEFVSADDRDDSRSDGGGSVVSSYHGSLNQHSSDSDSDSGVSDVSTSAARWRRAANAAIAVSRVTTASRGIAHTHDNHDVITYANSNYVANPHAEDNQGVFDRAGIVNQDALASPARMSPASMRVANGKKNQDEDSGNEASLLVHNNRRADDVSNRNNQRRALSPSRREFSRRARLSSSSSDSDVAETTGNDKEKLPLTLVPANSGRTDPPPGLRLTVVSGTSRGDSVVATVGKERITIGRAETHDLVVADVEVSSSHAELRWVWLPELGDENGRDDSDGTEKDAFGNATKGAWRVRDVGSTNGTFVNGCAVNRGGKKHETTWVVVSDGDELRFGERTESPVVSVALFRETYGFREEYRDTLELSSSGSIFHPGDENNKTGPMRKQSPPHHLKFAVRSDPGTPNSGGETRDAAVCESPLRGTRGVSVFAVFSGHTETGSTAAAEKAAKWLPEILAGRLPLGQFRHAGRGTDDETVGTSEQPVPPPNNDLADILKSAFNDLDRKIRCEYQGCSGAVLVVWRCPETKYLYAQTANAGDCEILLGRAGGSIPGGRDNGQQHQTTATGEVVTQKHTLRDLLERARLVGAGASLKAEEFQLRGLSVSRSLGDNFLKREIPGLTCVPFVSQPVRIKDDGRDVAVCATRGLWRSLEVGEVISCATASVFEKSSSNSSASQLAPSPRWTPSAGAARLVDLVRRRRGKEDVTVVVVRLEDTCGPGG